MPHPVDPLSTDQVERRIVIVRGVKVMLDSDLALLYDTTTMAFNQAVKRNLTRFPADFRFELTEEEYQAIRGQATTTLRRNVRHRPAVFTEHGVAMLSGVLRSTRAVQVNIAIMRAFNRLREAVSLHAELARRIGELELQYEGLTHRYDDQFARVFDALRELMRATDPKEEPPKRLSGS